MKRIILIIGIILICLAAVGIAYRQARYQRASLVDDLRKKTALLADSLKESIQPNFTTRNTSSLQSLLERFGGRENLLGLAVYNSKGEIFATSSNLPKLLTENSGAKSAIAEDRVFEDFQNSSNDNIYFYTTPLHRDKKIIGAVTLFQSAGYIEKDTVRIWKTDLLWLLFCLLLFVLATTLVLRWVIFRPISVMAEAIRKTRKGSADEIATSVKTYGFFQPIASEIFKMSKSLVLARDVASEEARLRLEKLDTPWTAERLKEFFKAHLKDRKIFVVSNREPYIHNHTNGEISVSVPAGGMVTALEPIMEACGGLWLAYGGGNADKDVVDKNDKVNVPPDEPKYQLKRIWLTEKEVKGYYNGFANEALWPLCHMAHTRPIFRKEDWTEYKKVNGKFAKLLLSEIKNVQNPIILIQDYHLALLPEMIKNSRPDAEIGLFWHIPWPNDEAFRICPWRKEILQGMLAADVIGFHIRQYCNSFLETAGKEIESIIDLEKFSITHKDHVAYVKPFPISVAFTESKKFESVLNKYEILENLNLKGKFLGLGVDRLDYTKGILEKFKGLEFFFSAHPSYKQQLTFVQIAAPSREGVEKYRVFSEKVTKEAERINSKFAKNGWQPILLLKEYHTREQIYPLYNAADFCLVTSLSDGMNLVAKEFVSARNDELGVLILSQFTGSSRDLSEAIMVNPYSAEETAETIFKALNMQAAEQYRRMKKMRESVKNYNIYRWASEFIKAVTKLE